MRATNATPLATYWMRLGRVVAGSPARVEAATMTAKTTSTCRTITPRRAGAQAFRRRHLGDRLQDREERDRHDEHPLRPRVAPVEGHALGEVDAEQHHPYRPGPGHEDVVRDRRVAQGAPRGLVQPADVG